MKRYERKCFRVKVAMEVKAYYSNLNGFRKEVKCILKDISLCGMGLIFLDSVFYKLKGAHLGRFF